MTGTLLLKGLSLPVFLGAFPEEKLFQRRVFMDLAFSGRRGGAGPAVDYALLCQALEELSGERFDYIEEVADRAFSLLSSRWPGRWKVTVRKPFPPVSTVLESAEYTIEG